jgi:uncharacterized membrane protein
MTVNEEGTPSPNDLTVAQAKQFLDAADKLRQRSDAAAKALAALGSTAVGAIGIAKFADVFPVPDGYWYLPYVVIAGFVAMAVAVVLFSAGLWRVTRPLYMRSDTTLMTDDLVARKNPKKSELALVERIFAEAARQNDASSLQALESRGWRLNRIAERTSDDARRTRLTAQAMKILTEVRTTQLRAAVIVIRKRTSSLPTSVGTWATVLLFVAGLVAVGVGADQLDSERGADDRRATAAKACADAAKAVTEQDLDPAKLLPRSCGEVPPPAKAQTSQGATVMETFADQYRKCVAAAVARGATDALACTPQLQIVVQANS